MLNCMVNNQSKLTKSGTIFKYLKLTTFINMTYQNVRWAFPISLWSPTPCQVLAASSFIQAEEKKRISQFVFQDDAKSALIGRLMMRKFVHLSTTVPYNEVYFGRSDHGKPFLLGDLKRTTNFNVSHQGDYVVLAGHTEKKVGIDIMKIVPPPNKNIQDFFRLMNRQFSKDEWNLIYNYHNELDQIACFYRLWCLKESYVKNIGLGITIPLNSISFLIKSPLKLGEIITDTDLHIENDIHNMRFEETLLDTNHAVAVSIHNKDIDERPVQFQFLNFNELLNEAVPLNDEDKVFTDNFMKKEVKKV